MPVTSLIGVLAAAIAGGVTLRLAHVPGGIVLGSMVGAALWTLWHDGPPVAVPGLLRDAALVVLGTVVGVGVTRDSLTGLRSLLLPAVVAALLVIAAGVGIALLLRALGAAPGDDVLATSPGALSAVLGIAVDRGVAPAEVALFHTVRLVLVMASLPVLVLLLPRSP